MNSNVLICRMGFKMYKRVCEYVEKWQMIKKNERILVGVSGGADSVCLFHMLVQMREEMGTELVVVHVHHMLRGESADEDCRYVENLAKTYGVPFYLVKKDVKREAVKHGISEEEAGRNIRYGAFYEIAEKTKCTKIAVAHHKDDQAETVLFHLFRGAGLRGLCGMMPVREMIIRPLLCLSRDEVLSYLARENIPFQTDETNEEDGYSRNQIRHHILPFAKERINSRAAEHAAEAAGHLQEVQRYVDGMTQEAYEAAVRGDGIMLDVFLGYDPFIQKQVIRKMLGNLAGSLKDIEAVHVEKVLQLCGMENGRRITLPYGMTAVRQYEKIRIFHGDMENVPVEKCILCIGTDDDAAPVTFRYIQENVTCQVVISVVTDEKQVAGIRETFLQTGVQISEEKKKNCTKCMDCGKINSTLFLRFPQTGDYMQIHAEGNTKKLNRIFIDEKVPFHNRGETPVLADGSHILWIAGLGRISEAYKVTEDTKKVLICEWTACEND